jgi:hypothetical protein
MRVRSILATTAAAACAVGLGIGTATTASAATDHVAAVSPDVNNFLTYDNNGALNGIYPCDSGRNYAPAAWPVAVAQNNCEYRVILYEYANLTGWHYCINPKSAATVPPAYQDPLAVKIGIHPNLNCTT